MLAARNPTLLRAPGQAIRRQSSIAVIGAGITGVTTARALVARGYDVTVFDRHRMSGMETSFANGGQLSASNAEVWNSWGTVLKGIKWMMRSDAPLLMNPWPSWHKYSWMAEFVANIPGYEANTKETVRLAISARQLLLDHAKEYNFEFDDEHRGILHFYATEKEYKHAEQVTKMYNAAGLERYSVTPKELADIEPALDADKYIGGFFTPSDFTGDIHRYTVGLAKGIEKQGVKFKCGVDEGRVQQLKASPTGGVDVVLGDPTGHFEGETFYGGKSSMFERMASEAGKTETQHFDGVVVCAGVRSRDFAAQLGDRVPIYPVKGYSITVNMAEEESQKAAPWVSLLDDDAKIVTSRLGAGRFRIAGTAEFNGFNRDIRHDRIMPLVRWCNTHFPGISTEDITPWSGLRPMMPNMLPKVGAGKAPGVFYNTGHGHLGWTLSAATAEMLGEAVSADMRLTKAQQQPRVSMAGKSVPSDAADDDKRSAATG